MTKPTLIGLTGSVYTRVVEMALRQKKIDYTHHEIDPFDDAGAAALADHQPFQRVPVLRHGGVTVFETTAILTYVDKGLPGIGLMPSDPLGRTRAVQVQSIVDAYGYWPLVRQVYVHGFFMQFNGHTPLQGELAAGLEASGPVLDALDSIAAEGLVLAGDDITRADCHLAPMIDAFVQADEARAMLAARPALENWYSALANQVAFRSTRPDHFKGPGG